MDGWMDGWYVIQLCINCNSYLLPNDGDDENPAWYSGHGVLDGTGFESRQGQGPFLLKCPDRLWHLVGSGAFSWG